MKGRVHSLQSMGGADGPGLRYVVFMQGCPLNCVYCHNPDARSFSGAAEYTAQELCDRIVRCKPYFGSTGGVTVSGGEPLAQPAFVSQLFSLLRARGIHTALDTSGICEPRDARPVLEYTSLVICDIKFPTQREYSRYTGGSLNTVLSFLSLTQEYKTDLWVRHVVVPGLTDTEACVKRVVETAMRCTNLKRIELLPFRKLCEVKYKQLGLDFALKDTPECDEQTLKKLYEYVPRHLQMT